MSPPHPQSWLPVRLRQGAKPTAVHLVTLGCARNEVDSEELAARLERDGFTLVADPVRRTR